VYLVANAAIEDLRATLGREPIPIEIAEHTGLPVGDVVEGLDAGGSRHATPLPAPDLRGVNRTGELAESDDGSCVASTEDRCFVAELLQSLPSDERHVLALSFFGGLAQSDIALKLGVSQSTVSRLWRQALRHLRMMSHENTAA
jgi:RNA polymerase sigma-B factor